MELYREKLARFFLSEEEVSAHARVCVCVERVGEKYTLL